MRYRCAALLLLASPPCLASAAEDLSTAVQLVSEPRVLVIAHRGDSARTPENTLPAFRSAIQAGADLVELDYYDSADGVPVVFHDKTLKRTTNAAEVFGRAEIPVAEKTLDDLQRLDAGAWFHPDFRDTKIPTLEEALDVIQQRSCTLIERKQGDAATCIALLQQKNLLDHVVVQAFDWQFLRECHQLAPRLCLAALGSKDLTPAKLDQIEQTGSRIVAWDHRDVGPDEIAAIQERGFRAWVYTVNDTQRAAELIRAGVDGIITDVPGKMLELMATSR